MDKKKKVILTLILFSIIFLSSCVPEFAPKKDPCLTLTQLPLLGDSNLDGKVDLKDVLFSLDDILADTKITKADRSLCNADINEDRRVNINDLKESGRIYTESYRTESIDCSEYLTDDSLMGDANSDGEVNVIDVVLLISFILGSSEPEPLQECILNLNSGDDIYLPENEDPIIVLNVLDIVMMINIILEEEPIEDIIGCTDENACNYDPEATLESGFCEYPEDYPDNILDCDGNCLNDEDGNEICDELEVVTGCTDPLADNYDPDAIEDDGSCTYSGEGIVDEDGGTITYGDTNVSIPEGALEGDVMINITNSTEQVSDIELPTGGEYNLSSDAYSFEPHGQTFSQPVTIYISYNSESNNLYFIKLEDATDTSWELLDGTFENGIGTVSVNSFSILSIVANESEVEEEIEGDFCNGVCEGGVGETGCYDNSPQDCICYCDELCVEYSDCCADIDDDGDEGYNDEEYDPNLDDDDEQNWYNLVTQEEYNAYCSIEEDQEENGDPGNGDTTTDDTTNGDTTSDDQEPDDQEAGDQPLFDIKVTLLEEYEKISPGDQVISNIQLFNFGGLTPVDVVLNCELNSFNASDEMAYDFFEETLAVDLQTSITRSMNMPDDAPLGSYLMDCSINYNETIEVSSSDAIFVVSKIDTRMPSVQLLAILGLSLLLVIAIIIIIILVLRIFNKKISHVVVRKSKKRKK